MQEQFLPFTKYTFINGSEISVSYSRSDESENDDYLSESESKSESYLETESFQESSESDSECEEEGYRCPVHNSYYDPYYN